ncbi:MAG: endo alpha-1,4 polygalactosaminidase [Hyphomicrobiaceae bacterium]
MSSTFVILLLAVAVVALAVGYVAGLRAGRRQVPASPVFRPTPISVPPADGLPDASIEDVPAAPGQRPSPADRPRSAGRARKPEVATPASRAAVESGDRSKVLAAAQSWGYQLQNLDVKRAVASPFDILVVDYAKDGDDESALKPAELARLKQRPDGGRRLMLAYFSIGEAESYRSYWQKDWKRNRPEWLLGENPDWEENYAVCFWDPGWQAILFGSPKAMLDKMMAQGFDGVYLDKCDVTEDLKAHEKATARTRPDLDGDMAALVRRLADYARQRDPGFLVVMQNAESLLERADVRAVLNASAKEELLYGVDKPEKANSKDDVTWSRERLDLMRGEGKPVLLVEYLNDREKIARAAEAAHQLGYLLYTSDRNRELDRLRYDMPEV